MPIPFLAERLAEAALAPNRRNQQDTDRPYVGAWFQGQPVKLEAHVRATLYEAVGITFQEQPAEARQLVGAVAEILGTHVEMADELDKEPRTNEKLRLIQDCASRAEGLRDAILRLDIDTSDAINQIAGDADLVTFAESLRLFSNRLAMAERRLLEAGRDVGPPRKTARAITLMNLVEVFRTFSPDGTDSDLVEFMKAACSAARDRAGKVAPIRLPSRPHAILALLTPTQ